MIRNVRRGESNLRLFNLTKNFMKGLENLILLDNDTRTEEEDEVEVEVGNPSFVNQVTNGTSLPNRMSDLELREPTTLVTTTE